MAAFPNGLLAASIRPQCEAAATRQERTDAAEFLFVVASDLIHAAEPHKEKFTIPYRGETPFYQGNYSAVLRVNRLATDELATLPYYDPDTHTHRTRYVQLAIDYRKQHNRNRLPVPLAFGKIALNPIGYKDKVLRLIETDRSDEDTTKNTPRYSRLTVLNHADLLMNNAGYKQASECRASGAELIATANYIEAVSHMVAAHDIVTEAAKKAVA